VQAQVGCDGITVGRLDPLGQDQIAGCKVRVESAGDAEADEGVRALG
jgi:hypothetical protein